MNGKCRESGIVYQAIVTSMERCNRSENVNAETYMGLTDKEFKARLANHEQSFSNPKLNK